MNYLILIADIDEFNPCKNSLGDIVEKEYFIKHMPAFDLLITHINVPQFALA